MRDYGKLLSWLDEVRTDTLGSTPVHLLGSGLRWAKVVFVGSAAFQSKLVKDLQASGWSQADVDNLLLFDTKLLYQDEDRFFI